MFSSQIPNDEFLNHLSSSSKDCVRPSESGRPLESRGRVQWADRAEGEGGRGIRGGRRAVLPERFA